MYGIARGGMKFFLRIASGVMPSLRAAASLELWLFGLSGLPCCSPSVPGVLAWGVGGIEAEAVMLGQPLYLVTPQVVGFKLTGQLRDGVTATDLVLTVTQMLWVNLIMDTFAAIMMGLVAVSAVIAAVGLVPAAGPAFLADGQFLTAGDDKLARRFKIAGDAPTKSLPHPNLVDAVAFDDTGKVLATAELRGVNVYTYTAGILAWGARQALEGGLKSRGALGPGPQPRGHRPHAVACAGRGARGVRRPDRESARRRARRGLRRGGMPDRSAVRRPHRVHRRSLPRRGL